MLVYTNKEKIQMIKWYYSGSSAEEVVGRFAFFFENRPVPTFQTVLKIVHTFESTGCVRYCKKCTDREVQQRPLNAEREQREVTVCGIVERGEPCSSQKIAEEVGVEKRTVQNILKRNGYHCYKVKKRQEIFPEDAAARLIFCEDVMNRANTDENFTANILFTDESSFSLHGHHNPSVTRYWSKENKHLSLPLRTQYPQKLNVWAGVVGNNIVGPFFIDGNLTALKYLELLRDQILPAIRNLGRNIDHIWYQQDNCPAHCARNVQFFLRETFGTRIICGRNTIAWPPRSPDLSPLDFFFWGYVKQTIYQHEYNRAHNLQELRIKIIDAVNNIPPAMLTQVREEFYNRLGYCQAKFGGIFENEIR